MTDSPAEITVRTWVTRGMLLVNTSALEIDDPDHKYNQIIAQGGRPEDYGVNHPYTKRFEKKSRNELIEEILRLEKEINGLARADAIGVLLR